MNKVNSKYTGYLLRNFSRSLLFLLTLNTTQTVHANITTIDKQQLTLEQERKEYKKALIAYQNRQYRRFSKYTSELKTYPLYPYLRYKELRKNLSPKNLNSVRQFLNDYDDSPVSAKLRIRLLKSLARQNLWKDYLQSYRYTKSEKLQCLYLKALYKEGFIEPAFQQVPDLWMVSKSQHKSCNFIFRKFDEAGKITDKMVWDRIKISMDKRKIHLAKYLSQRLPKDDQAWVTLWVRSHYKPEILYTHPLVNKAHPQLYTILTHAIKRLIRKDTKKAIHLLSFLNEKTGIPYANKIDIYKKIGLTLAQRHDESAFTWLNKIPDEDTSDYINEWKIQFSIRHEQWPVIISLIDKMPKGLQQKIRWQFWWGYAHKQLGHEIESAEILNRVAEKRDYYGFLAADLTNQAYNFEDSPIKLNQKLIEKISALPGILRAKEFYHFKQIANARREWNHAIADFPDEYLLSAAKIAYSWGWHDRAIAAIGKTKNLNDVEIRFPLVYKDIIDNYSKKYKIDSAWTYAIIRRESIFINDAKSHKGALGLMQLLPRTARATARAIKTSYQGTRQLIKIKPNIRLGTHYLKSLFRKHKQQTVLATAAYNAGPSNVRKWLPENKPMDAIRWIESIPFKETREYVTNVLAYNIIYQFRMGLNKQTQLSQLMPQIPAKI